MCFFKRLIQKEKPKEIPARPPWAEIVEIMYDKQLDAFSDEVVNVVYSKDKTMRYVVLKDQKGFFTYQLEAIYPFDEDEWKYAFTGENTLPAMWEPFRGITGKSVFENREELYREMQAEPEYKRCF